MKVIVPCAGRSTRFPGVHPKWLLRAPSGEPMLLLALSGIGVMLDDVVVTVMKDHEETYGVKKQLTSAFGCAVNIVVLDRQTASQPETVARTIDAIGLREQFMVKDCDGYFLLPSMPSGNFVCVDSLSNHSQVNPQNKSYCDTDAQGSITNMKEKIVISDKFSVGGYGFSDPLQFMEHYMKLHSTGQLIRTEMHISDIIGSMVLDGIPFYTNTVSGYSDWGTMEDWQRFCEAE
jgi:hypothetical protein